jgi:transcriptional regulator with XRE-family HTH domain
MVTTDFLKVLGQRIRFLRQAKGLSQEKLAETAGIHPTYVSEIELGKANASISIFDHLATGLGVTLPDLVKTQDLDEDFVFMEFMSQVRSLDDRHRKVFLETAEAVLKGMREF